MNIFGIIIAFQEFFVVLGIFCCFHNCARHMAHDRVQVA